MFRRSRDIVRAVHARAVFGRRVTVLAARIADLMPNERAKVLDVGCGSGDIASALGSLKPLLKLAGVDVLVRPGAAIPVTKFDGNRLPFPNDSFDYALLIDVLHHADDPRSLIAEVARVARQLIVKDHYRDGLFSTLRLRFMDWVGNAPHGVRLPYNYLSKTEWSAIWNQTGLRVEAINENLALYPFPADHIFGRGLHFIAQVTRA